VGLNQVFNPNVASVIPISLDLSSVPVPNHRAAWVAQGSLSVHLAEVALRIQDRLADMARIRRGLKIPGFGIKAAQKVARGIE